MNHIALLLSLVAVVQGHLQHPRQVEDTSRRLPVGYAMNQASTSGGSSYQPIESHGTKTALTANDTLAENGDMSDIREINANINCNVEPTVNETSSKHSRLKDTPPGASPKKKPFFICKMIR